MQFVFIVRDALHTDGLQVIDGGAEPDHARYVRRSGFEFIGQFVVDRLIKADLEDHVAAALPWRHCVE